MVSIVEGADVGGGGGGPASKEHYFYNKGHTFYDWELMSFSKYSHNWWQLQLLLSSNTRNYNKIKIRFIFVVPFKLKLTWFKITPDIDFFRIIMFCVSRIYLFSQRNGGLIIKTIQSNQTITVSHPKLIRFCNKFVSTEWCSNQQKQFRKAYVHYFPACRSFNYVFCAMLTYNCFSTGTNWQFQPAIQSEDQTGQRRKDINIMSSALVT